jgi:hypothetical protein
MHEGESGLVADGVIAPDFRDVYLVVSGEPPGYVDGARGNVQVKWHSSSAEVGPFRQRLQVIDRFGSLYLDRASEPARSIRGCQNDVGKYLDMADLDRCGLLLADVRLDVMPALETRLQQSNDAVMLELLADRPHQDRAHLTSLNRGFALPDPHSPSLAGTYAPLHSERARLWRAGPSFGTRTDSRKGPDSGPDAAA